MFREQELEKRLASLIEEQHAYDRQYSSTIDEGQRVRLKRIIDNLEQEIENLNLKITGKDLTSNDFNRRSRIFAKNLSKIDFNKIIDKIDKLIRQFRRKGVRGDALLILQESLSMAGDLCLTEIRERFSRETGDFKHIKFEFSPHTERLDKIGLLDGLAKYLGIKFTQDKIRYEQEYIHTIIQKICHSLQGGSIVFLELRKWDALPSQKQELSWFLTDFWIPLVEQLDAIAQTHRQVKFISVIVADAKLSPGCLELPVICSNDHHLRILKLSLRKWKIDDIQIWLESYPGLRNPKSLKLAQHIHKSSKGIPAMVCNELSREFLQ